MLKRIAVDSTPPDGFRPRRAVVAAAFLAAALSGCTVSDGPLIPPRPIPGIPSDAVAVNADSEPPARAPAMRTSPPYIAPAPVDNSQVVAQAPLAAPQVYRAPAPHRSRQARRAAAFPPPHRGGRAHSFPAGETNSDTLSPPPPPPPPPPPTRTATASAPSIRFTPVVGAPASAIEPLSQQLESSAEHQGIIIRNDPQKPVDDILRGYFSASNDGNRTTVVFVWDVLDPNGDRLHRIEGREVVKSRPGEPWASVPASTMKEIARQTIEAYKLWHASKRLDG